MDIVNLLQTQSNWTLMEPYPTDPIDRTDVFRNCDPNPISSIKGPRPMNYHLKLRKNHCSHLSQILTYVFTPEYY